MAINRRIGFLLWGRQVGARDAFADEKYRDLAAYFDERGLKVETLTYHDALAEHAFQAAQGLDGLLVWVNPIEDGQNRERLDQLLEALIARGVMVSSLPATIRQIGTKRVLYDTRQTPFGSDVRLYETFEAFQAEFEQALMESRVRVLKQYRGDGGNGVFRVSLRPGLDKPIEVLHAQRGAEPEHLTLAEVWAKFRPYFDGGRPLIDQAWHPGLFNGVVRCYLSGAKVAGFGYQEINALYQAQGAVIAPSRRYYFTENCGLFGDLKAQLEAHWLTLLMEACQVAQPALPVIWDCDFFLTPHAAPDAGKYALCEINASCVSPFPPSAISIIYAEVLGRLRGGGRI